MYTYTVISKNGQKAFSRLPVPVTMRLLATKPSGVTIWEVTSSTEITSLLLNNKDFTLVQ